MAKLGFLGLGIMGYPMARNLLRAGHEVALWSNTASKAQELAAAEKGRFCATPREVGEFADVIFLCVGDTAMSEKVILGEDGIVSGAKKGTIIADASTISPSDSRRIGAELSKSGISFLKEIFEEIRPFIEAMGKKIYYCGSSGMGLNAKLTQNLILCNILGAFNEGLVLSTKAGVDPDLMLEILDNSAAKSGLIAYKAPFVLRRDFSTNFSTKWMHKDIGLMLDSAAELDVPLPLTAISRQMFQMAISSGFGDQDMCSTIQVLEKISGVEVKKF
jgi:3-hydroxyisobutyrate dehydrogenase-like beta-hydroxyacid dehydrogenase